MCGPRRWQGSVTRRCRCRRCSRTLPPVSSSGCRPPRRSGTFTPSVAQPRAVRRWSSSGAFWSRGLKVPPKPVVQRLGVGPYLDHLLAGARAAEPRLETKVLPDIQRLAPEERLAWVVLRPACRDSLQLLASDLVARPRQALHDGGELLAAALGCGLLAELRQLFRSHHVAPGCDSEAARVKRQVATPIAFADSRRDVGLVWRLVLAEADVAVGSEDLA